MRYVLGFKSAQQSDLYYSVARIGGERLVGCCSVILNRFAKSAQGNLGNLLYTK